MTTTTVKVQTITTGTVHKAVTINGRNHVVCGSTQRTVEVDSDTAVTCTKCGTVER